MKARRKVSRRKSRKMFTKTADKTHKYNLAKAPMRGGIRM